MSNHTSRHVRTTLGINYPTVDKLFSNIVTAVSRSHSSRPRSNWIGEQILDSIANAYH